jgi:hypothetical protein
MAVRILWYSTINQNIVNLKPVIENDYKEALYWVYDYLEGIKNDSKNLHPTAEKIRHVAWNIIRHPSEPERALNDLQILSNVKNNSFRIDFIDAGWIEIKARGKKTIIEMYVQHTGAESHLMVPLGLFRVIVRLIDSDYSYWESTPSTLKPLSNLLKNNFPFEEVVRLPNLFLAEVYFDTYCAVLEKWNEKKSFYSFMMEDGGIKWLINTTTNRLIRGNNKKSFNLKLVMKWSVRATLLVLAITTAYLSYLGLQESNNIQTLIALVGSITFIVTLIGSFIRE